MSMNTLNVFMGDPLIERLGWLHNNTILEKPQTDVED